MITIDKLGDRDGWSCHICGKPVPQRRFRRRSLRGQAPTRDHVIPQREGGPNAASNLRLAHKACNEARGHQPVESAQIKIRKPIDRREVERRARVWEIYRKMVTA